MTIIGNIGVGLIILIILWILTLCVFVYSVRTQSNIGWIVLVAATVITITLLVIPTENKDKQEDISTPEEKDYATVYKRILLFFLVFSALLACIVFFFVHCIETVRAKPIKTF